MLFEIINPCDHYTLETDDRELAALACVAIGGGGYALRQIGGEWEVPVFIFGGADEWFTKNFGAGVSECLERRLGDLAPVLRSVVIGDREQYERQRLSLESEGQRKAFRDSWHDKYRTSMNDIGRYAWDMADRIEAQGEPQP